MKQLLLLAACIFAVSCNKKSEVFYGRQMQLSKGLDWNTITFGMQPGELWVAGGVRYFSGYIAHSPDIGISWQEEKLHEKAFLGSHLAADSSLWLCGIDGIIWRYTPATGWLFLRNYIYHTLEAITTLSSPSEVAVCGGGNFKKGLVARIDQYGSLDVQRDTFEMEFGSIIRTDSAVIVGGYGSIHRSTDTARTWVHVYTPKDHIVRLAVDNSQHVWALGLTGSVHRSTDHGKTWTRLAIGQWAAGIVYAAFAVSPDGQKIVKAAADGTVAISINGGQDWTFGRVDGLPDARWRSAVANNSTFYMVGNAGAAVAIDW